MEPGGAAGFRGPSGPSSAHLGKCASAMFKPCHSLPTPPCLLSHLLLTLDTSAISCSPRVSTRLLSPLFALLLASSILSPALPAKSCLNTQPKDPLWCPWPAGAPFCSLSVGIPASPSTPSKGQSPAHALPATRETPTLGDNKCGAGWPWM